MTTMRRARMLVFVVLIGSALTSCGGGGKDGADDDGGGGSSVPSLPAPSTMSVDLSLADTALNLDDPRAFGWQGVTGGFGPAVNYAQASAVVLNVSSNIAVPLSLPVAALRAAASVKPLLQSESTWGWSFDLTHRGRDYVANMLGKRLGAGRMSWSLRVTTRARDANTCCDAFEVISGETTDKGGGTWQIYDLSHPTKPTRVLGVTFGKTDAKGDERVLRFEVNSDRAPALRFGRGSTVTYTATKSKLMLSVLDSSESGPRIISWNRSTRAGEHEDPQGGKTCWDAESNAFANIACP